MENGAFYISSVQAILSSKNRLSGKISLYEMPEYSGFEIDEPEDWKIVEGLLLRHLSPLRKNYSQIKLFLSDVDGVMTDAGMYYSAEGDTLKKFHTQDGMGLHLLQEKGIKVGVVTGENTPIVSRRAEKLKLDFVHIGIKDKLPVVRKICSDLNIGLENVAYIGDDINDIEVLRSVGFAACPQNAVSAVRHLPEVFRLSKSGGEGVVREWIDFILNQISETKV